MYKFSNYNVVCMLINRLLKLLGEEAEIDDELYEKIHDNMIERLKDKVAEIRAQAVHALQRLQDPRDDQCPIIKVSVLVQKQFHAYYLYILKRIYYFRPSFFTWVVIQVLLSGRLL